MSLKKFGIAALILTLLGGGVFLLLRGNDPSEGDVQSATTTVSVKDDQIGMMIEKDTSLTQTTLKPEQRTQGQLWELKPQMGSGYDFVIDARFEQGDSLKKLTGYTKQSLRDSVVANVNLQLPKQHPKYRQVTQRNTSINGIDANETIFEYEISGVKVKQRLVLLFKNSETAVYIRGQAPATDFDSVNSKYFEPIVRSVKFE